MLWTALLGLHLIGLTGYTLLLRKSALGSIDKFLLAALMQTAVYLPVPFLIAILGVDLTMSAWQWLMLVANGLTIVGIQLLGILALKYLEVSVWTIVFNLRLLFVTVFGFIFLSELPTPLQLLGGFIIFMSILALNLHRHGRYRTRPILIGILATIFYSVHSVLEKYNVDHVGIAPYLLVSGTLATSVLWILLLRRRVKMPHVIQHFDWHLVQLLGLRILSGWAYLLALPLASVAVMNYVSGMGAVLIVVCGIYFLGERDQLREKFIALSIAVVGLTLIFLGRP
jgi:drug/metabolite transporter (DMT)-like permease